MKLKFLTHIGNKLVIENNSFFGAFYCCWCFLDFRSDPFRIKMKRIDNTEISEY